MSDGLDSGSGLREMGRTGGDSGKDHVEGEGLRRRFSAIFWRAYLMPAVMKESGTSAAQQHRGFSARRCHLDRRPRRAWMRPPWLSRPPGRIRGAGSACRK